MTTTDQIQLILSKYDISENGFLPKKPVPKLTGVFEQWEQIVTQLPELNKNKTTREAIDALDDLGLNWLYILNDPWQVKRAYVVLSLLTNSYVFSDNIRVAQVIPKKLAVPLWSTASKLGISPILTHAAVDLFNWELIDSNKPFELDNLKSTSLMTGAVDEEWFYLVMVAIEQHGGPIIRQMLELSMLGDLVDIKLVSQRLSIIESKLQILCKIIKRMNEKCDPEFFYNKLRPFIGGWKNNDALPNGMVYGGVSKEAKYYYGGSAAQSTLIQVIDHAFGINHESPYFIEIREYMPKSHREFIQYVKDNLNIKQFVEEYNDSQLNNILENCIKNLVQFRKLHYDLVTNYIIKQKNKQDKDSETKGTGGTLLKKFLKSAIKETTKVKDSPN